MSRAVSASNAQIIELALGANFIAPDGLHIRYSEGGLDRSSSGPANVVYTAATFEVSQASFKKTLELRGETTKAPSAQSSYLALHTYWQAHFFRLLDIEFPAKRVRLEIVKSEATPVQLNKEFKLKVFNTAIFGEGKIIFKDILPATSNLTGALGFLVAELLTECGESEGSLTVDNNKTEAFRPDDCTYFTAYKISASKIDEKERTAVFKITKVTK